LKLIVKSLDVLVSAIVPGSDGDHAGLRAGDVIVSVDGKPLDGLSLPQVEQLLSDLANEVCYSFIHCWIVTMDDLD
jgi:S1-C subfamily serine protease